MLLSFCLLDSQHLHPSSFLLQISTWSSLEMLSTLTSLETPGFSTLLAPSVTFNTNKSTSGATSDPSTYLASSGTLTASSSFGTPGPSILPASLGTPALVGSWESPGSLPSSSSFLHPQMPCG